MSHERRILRKPADKWTGWSVALLAVLTGVWLAACNPHRGEAPPSGTPEVGVVTARPQKVVLTTELPGRTSSFRVAEIRPQVSGLILKRLFKEGADVVAGQVLYQIDPAPFEAALANAEAALARAESNLPPIRLRVERFRELLPDKAVSQQDYDDAVAALAQAEAEIEYWKAQVKTARINLGYTKITAPISGRIGKSNVTEGAIVTAYQPVPLATIHQLDPIYVDVPQSTTELLRLKKRLREGGLARSDVDETKVKLVLEDGTPYPREGVLQFREVSVDPTTGSVIVRMIFPNAEKVLLPNMFVRAVITEGVREDAILVPQQAVARTPDGEPYVMVVGPGDRAEMKRLELGRAIGDRWLVVSGLSPGDRVIVEGLQFVRPGMQVKATPWEEEKTVEKARDGGAAAEHGTPAGGA